MKEFIKQLSVTQKELKKARKTGTYEYKNAYKKLVAAYQKADGISCSETQK